MRAITAVLIAMLALSVSVAFADEVSVSPGVFVQGEYTAATVTVARGSAWFYAEQQVDGPYTLLMAGYKPADVLWLARTDNERLRLGAEVNPWNSCLRVWGYDPWRADVTTPPVKIVRGLDAMGYVKYQAGCKPYQTIQFCWKSGRASGLYRLCVDGQDDSVCAQYNIGRF
ncbi:MAG: hypothetical protein WC080_03215 [Patescibacteria group bacterium]|jgi:hypothetical protein